MDEERESTTEAGEGLVDAGVLGGAQEGGQVGGVGEQGVAGQVAQEDEAAETADGGLDLGFASAGVRTAMMPVRDSKDPDAPALLFPADAWRSFLTAIHAGEFDTA
ncbi:DUF397 domain-containing protein [Kitasatospora sp. NPDC058218]|uniref:DUF397 domain-containing protein n=1 Tax=Kitasatospora sp. NPDC058218 TaxID=3346385 RepID=UPI0036DA2B2E